MLLLVNIVPHIDVLPSGIVAQPPPLDTSGENLIVIRLTMSGKEYLEPKYLYYQLLSLYHAKVFHSLARDADQQYITVEAVKFLKVGPFPLGELAEVFIKQTRPSQPGDIFLVRVHDDPDQLGFPYFVE